GAGVGGSGRGHRASGRVVARPRSTDAVVWPKVSLALHGRCAGPDRAGMSTHLHRHRSDPVGATPLRRPAYRPATDGRTPFWGRPPAYPGAPSERLRLQRRGDASSTTTTCQRGSDVTLHLHR